MSGCDGLMSIGEFARRSRLPASTLRYYHQLGLLEPARLDRSTGYRFYAPEQLATAALIAELRGAGVRPAAIGAVTRGGTDLVAALAGERDRIAGEIRDRRKALAGLDALLVRLAVPATAEVGFEDAPSRRYAALAGAVRSEVAAADVRRLIVVLRGRIRAAGCPGPLRYGAAFPLDLASDPVPATVLATTADGDEPPGGPTLPRYELAAGRRAVVVHDGDLALAPAYAALLDRVAALGLRPVGPVVEEYEGTAQRPSTRISVGIAG